MRNLIIILGDQLNLDNPALENFDATQDKVLMIESLEEAGHVWSHKARIALFLSAMRHYAEALLMLDMPVIYLKMSADSNKNLESAWKEQIAKLKPQKIIVCEPGDYRVLKMLEACVADTSTMLVIKDDTHFMCSQADFKHWAASGKQLRMEFFYRMMRKKYQVLMQSDQPHGGKWNYDADNRDTFAKQGPKDLPEVPKFVCDAITQQVFADVDLYFNEHPGTLANFCWPVTREQALIFLDDFIEKKLKDFGKYQDAMWQASTGFSPFLWHSLLASSLNLKLLSPREVITAAEQAYHASQSSGQPLPLASVEGFVRQILGWREFVHGMYWLDMPDMAIANYYHHERALPKWYWTANTQMNCLRQTIKQTLEYSYAHHIQRLMITGMFGVLAELKPQEVAAWYLAVYVDAVEWVELPNTVGMALYANGGRFTSKPYIASGAYIKRMSNYCGGCRYKPEIKTGPDACPYTTLYWNFLIKHYDEFARNPRTALMVKHVERFSEDEKQAISAMALQRLDNLNNL